MNRKMTLLAFGGKCGCLRRQRIAACLAGKKAILLEEGVERQGAEAAAGLEEKVASIHGSIQLLFSVRVAP